MTECVETPGDVQDLVEESASDVSGLPTEFRRSRPARTTSAMLVGAASLAAMGAVAGFLGYQSMEGRRETALRHEFVEVARQGAINLTTIDFTTVDADVRRILDSSTGAFRDDFESRSQPFIDVVKNAQSKSIGTVTAAALESENGDQAQVLVTVAMKTTTPAVADQSPQLWRMRIAVRRAGDETKVSDVQFVA